MPKLILRATDTAQWHDLVADAKAHWGKSLHEDLESYLVFLLQRFCDKPELADSVLGMEYLRSSQSPRLSQLTKLRDVGDKCLLFSGLFPECAEHKHVNVMYFVELGQKAYGVLSDLHDGKTSLADLYESLGEEFVKLMQLLHCIRELGDHPLELSPIEAESLWRNTSSEHALSLLREVTDSFSVHVENSHLKHLH